MTSLQQLLASDPTSGFTATPNGFFGPQTAKAVAHFQVVNGIASSSTGTVGPLTRNFFEQRCGAQQPPMAPGGQPGQPGVGQVMVGGMVGGTINSVSGNTVTVQTPDGATRIVTLSASTTIEVFTGTSTPPTVGTISNLTAGLKIAADGKLNTDNSISALHVRVGTLPPPPPARTAPNMPGILKTIQSVLGQPAQGMSAQGGIQTQ